MPMEPIKFEHQFPHPSAADKVGNDFSGSIAEIMHMIVPLLMECPKVKATQPISGDLKVASVTMPIP